MPKKKEVSDQFVGDDEMSLIPIDDESLADFLLPAIALNRYQEEILKGPIPEDKLRIYYCDINQYELLTAQQEVEFAQRIEAGLAAAQELAELQQKGEAQTARMSDLETIVADGQKARETMIECNTRLVVSIAKRCKELGLTLPLPDLIQEGNLGLMRAIEKFDYRLGYKFSTYATWWIRQAIDRAEMDQARTIRIPVNQHTKLQAFYRQYSGLEQFLGTRPTIDDLLKETTYTEEQIEHFLSQIRQISSLDDGLNDEDTDSDTWIEYQHSDELTPEEELLLKQFGDDIENMLEKLPPRESEILKLWCGFADNEKWTFETIGIKLGVTPARIRQLKDQAINRIITASQGLRLKEYLKD